MPERYSPFSNYDAAAVQETLRAESHQTRDVAHGDGEAMTIADGKAVLEVYPGAGVARATTAHARVELFRVPRYSLSAERVIFEQGDDDDRTRLLVTRDGKVSFHPVLRATQWPTTDETDTHEQEVSVSPTGPAESVSRPAEAAIPTPGNTALDEEHGEAGEPESVQLTGRLGRDPWFNTEGDTLIGGFPLAVNDDTGKTTWHRVVAFGEAAAQLQKASERRQISKGRLVEVTGQHVLREEQTERGGKRTNKEFHTTSVTRLTASKSRPTQRG